MTGPEPSRGGERHARIHVKEYTKETYQEGNARLNMYKEMLGMCYILCMSSSV
jgi:hypothetical protein